jgi:hypothetical protein
MRWSKEIVRLDCLWLPRLLVSVGACFDLVGTSKRLLYVNHVRYVWSRSLRGSSVKSVWHVHRVFACSVYINSKRYDSRI